MKEEGEGERRTCYKDFNGRGSEGPFGVEELKADHGVVEVAVACGGGVACACCVGNIHPAATQCSDVGGRVA